MSGWSDWLIKVEIDTDLKEAILYTCYCMLLCINYI